MMMMMMMQQISNNKIYQPKEKIGIHNFNDDDDEDDNDQYDDGIGDDHWIGITSVIAGWFLNSVIKHCITGDKKSRSGDKWVSVIIPIKER